MFRDNLAVVSWAAELCYDSQQKYTNKKRK